MAEHAKRFSPSAAERWMTCPGSVHLISTLNIVSRGGAAANRGTAIHMCAEKALEQGLKCENYIGLKFQEIEITEEMAQIGQVYVDFINQASGDKFYEQKVSVDKYVEDCFGTADCVICKPEKLVIVDLKTGRIRVGAKENKQLLVYALGAYLKYDWIYDFKEITIVIVQPVLEAVDSYTITLDELLAFGETLIEAKAQIDARPDLFITSEHGCQWCPAKFACPKHIEIANKAAAEDFAFITVEPNSLAYWLAELPKLKGFIDSLENRAFELLSQGDEIPGFGLGKGQSRRSWADELEVLKFANAKGLENLLLKQTLLSPAQVDKLKLDPQVQKVLSEYVSTTVTKQPIVRLKSVASDFSTND